MVHTVKNYHHPDLSTFDVLGRVMCGTLKSGDRVQVFGENYSLSDDEDRQVRTCQTLWIAQARYRVEISHVPAGNWVLIGRRWHGNGVPWRTRASRKFIAKEMGPAVRKKGRSLCRVGFWILYGTGDSALCGVCRRNNVLETDLLVALIPTRRIPTRLCRKLRFAVHIERPQRRGRRGSGAR